MTGASTLGAARINKWFAKVKITTTKITKTQQLGAKTVDYRAAAKNQLSPESNPVQNSTLTFFKRLAFHACGQLTSMKKAAADYCRPLCCPTN